MSQSLSSRAMSFDAFDATKGSFGYWSQSLSSRAMSFDPQWYTHLEILQSQSLSSRAMSFDALHTNYSTAFQVSIPFEQGDVFRRTEIVK